MEALERKEASRVEQLEQALREKDAQISQMRAEISILKTASALTRERDQLQSGLFWDLLMRYRSAKDRYLPPGSRRRAWYDWGLSAIKRNGRHRGITKLDYSKNSNHAPVEAEQSGSAAPLAAPVSGLTQSLPPHMKSLRITADGNAIVEPRHDYISYRLAEIPDASSFFSALFDGYIHLMNIDVTDNCNLRCPFCFSDFTKATSTRMSEEVFDKVLSLLPLVPEQSFFVSCAFEPFLHPRFTELLKRIPANQKNKGFFTTNLTIPLSPAIFEDLSVSNINHMNISLDSLDATTFEQLRLRGKFTVFKRQLETLVSVFRNAANPPKLRYITMAFRQNLHELPTLVRATHENYLPYEHEIRLPFDYTSMDSGWKAASMLTAEEWYALEKTIAGLGYRVKFMNQCYQPFYGRTYNA